MMEGDFSHELMPPRKSGVKSRGQGGRCAEKDHLMLVTTEASTLHIHCDWGKGLPIHAKQQKQDMRQTNKSFTVELLGEEAPSHSHLDIFKMCSSFGVGPVYRSFFLPLTHPKGTSASALGNRKSPNITAKMVKLCNPVLDKMQPNEREDEAILLTFKQLSSSFPVKRKHKSRHERLSLWTWQKPRALSFLTFEFSLTSSQSSTLLSILLRS